MASWSAVDCGWPFRGRNRSRIVPSVGLQGIKSALLNSGRWLFAAILALLIILFPIWISLSASPVVSRSTASATVKSITQVPQPDSASPSTEIYRYMVVVDSDATTAFVNDLVSRPHPLGSVVLLERRIHADGTVSYRMAGSTR